MTLKSQMAADAAIFFNLNEFGEAATYNGSTVTVIPEIGATLQNGNTIDTTGFSNRAVFCVPVASVPHPSGTDTIIHAGKTWYVVRVLESDSVSHRIECVGTVAPHRLR